MLLVRRKNTTDEWETFIYEGKYGFEMSDIIAPIETSQPPTYSTLCTAHKSDEGEIMQGIMAMAATI
jgi:hypothetical protein